MIGNIKDFNLLKYNKYEQDAVYNKKARGSSQATETPLNLPSLNRSKLFFNGHRATADRPTRHSAPNTW
jgi:hypothetical protein